MAKGNYVVVGAFRVKENSNRYKKQLADAGYSSEIGFSSKTGLNYVYVFSDQDLFKARESREKFRVIDKFEFPNSWILRIE